MRKLVAAITGLIFLCLYNYSIYDKQNHLETGMVVNVALAPVDPRSLMQGDFMDINYQISRDIRNAILEKNKKEQSLNAQSNSILPEINFAVVRLGEGRVAEFVRLDDGSTIAPSEARLQYRVRNNRVKFATNAFFFEEGTGEAYEEARFGQFRVNEKGEVLLSGLLNEKLELIKSQ